MSKHDNCELILVINVGSTSTKLGIYRNGEELSRKSFRYDSSYLEQNFATVYDQEELRMGNIRDFLDECGISPKDLTAVVTRGAIIRPTPSGCLEVTDALVEDARRFGGFHPVALGVRLALDFAREAGVACYTVDPPTVDELFDVARISGFPEIEREVQYQPLNQRSTAKRWCRETGHAYSQTNIIVAHMGGGTTVGAHHHGRVVDVNNGCLGEGPMTPERPGSVPLIPIIRECYSGEYTQDEMEYRVFHGGGIKAYLGTSDLQEVEERADAGDISAQLMLEAYAYQVAKEIGAMAAVLNGEVDAVLLTGGAAFSPTLSALVSSRVRGLAKDVAVYPGESELDALAEGVQAYLRGDEPLVNYDELPERPDFWQQVLEREKSRREMCGGAPTDAREAHGDRCATQESCEAA